MRILVSGASGFIGKPLTQLLRDKGHEVLRLVRSSEDQPDTIAWDPEKGLVRRELLNGFDAVVNLAGESVFAFRWTQSKMRKIQRSRLLGTLLLSKLFASSLSAPKVFLSASAIGYYGSRGEEILDEESPPGRGFLPEVCTEWERACQDIESRGSRVVHPRFGIVLGKGGGALQSMLLPYRLGLGGKLGDGKQWMSWIALEDVLSAIYFALTHSAIKGPFIVASPHPVRQEEFSRKLSFHLHRRAPMHYPKWLLKLLSGQAAEELLLSSINASPKKLLQAGFHFQKASLDSALAAAL